MTKTALRAVTPDDPCPVCSGDHKCSVDEAGHFIICGRSRGVAPGFLDFGPAQGDPQYNLYRSRTRRADSVVAAASTGRSAGPDPATDWGRLALGYEQELTPGVAKDLASILGLPLEVILRLGIGYIEREACWTFSERDADGKVVGINRRYRDGSKRMMKGGSRGLCYADDWGRPEGPIFVPEGPSDWATLVAMGLATVARPSNTGGIEQLAELLAVVPADRPIIVCGENDRKSDGRWPGLEGAGATAERLAKRLRRPILCVLPPEGTKDIRAWFNAQGPDLGDPASLRGLGATLLDSTRGEAREVLPWDPIRELCDAELPSFPTESLAPWQRDFVVKLATATQTPPDLAAMLVLATAAAAVAKRAVVRIREGYSEPLNLFVMVQQPPAARKTSVFREVLQPIEEHEREIATLARPAIAVANSQLAIDRKTLEELERRASKAQEEVERAGLTEQARALAEDLAARRQPEVPRWLVDDATPESLINRMALNGGRIFAASPEGGLIEMIGGRYSQGKSSANMAVYLKGHAGDQIRVDRMNRPPEFIDKPALSIALAVQPSVVEGLASNPNFRSRGLLGRFAYSLPPSKIGRRDLDPEPVSPAVREAYRSATRALLAIEPAVDERGEPVEHVIGLLAGAYDRWLSFAGWLEPQLGDFGALAHVSDWGGKLAGAVARVAGILHLADLAGRHDPWATPIPAATMVRAVAIGRYLIPHALAAYASMGADPVHSDAKYLLDWIRRNGSSSFKRSDCYEATKGHFRSVESMAPALKALEDHNYIAPKPAPARTGPGRPPGPAYDVNPAAFRAASRSAWTPPVPGVESDLSSSVEDIGPGIVGDGSGPLAIAVPVGSPVGPGSSAAVEGDIEYEEGVI